jgi:hypothetical protein
MRKRTSARANRVLLLLQLAVIAAFMAGACYFLLKPISVNAALTIAGPMPLDPLATLHSQKIEYSNALARPIFETTRRPWTAPVQPEAPSTVEEFEAVKIIVSGITISKGKVRVLLRQQDSPAAEWYSEGEIFAGWQILRVLPDRVKLSRGNQEQALTLYESTPE